MFLGDKPLNYEEVLSHSEGVRWSSTTTLPEDHHVPRGEFCITFHKLKEFLNLEHGNHSVYGYSCQFNCLTHYGAHHVVTDAKKAELFHKGLTVQLQDHLNLFPNLSYKELVSAAIDKEGSMKACVEAEENKRKRIMSQSSRSGGSSGAPPKYSMVYTPPTGQLRRPQQQYWGNHLHYQ
jgi:hypothetical protein